MKFLLQYQFHFMLFFYTQQGSCTKCEMHKVKYHKVKLRNVKLHNVRATKILGVSAQDIPHRMNFSIRQIFKYLNSLHSTYVIKFCKRQFLVINLYFSIWNRTVSHKTLACGDSLQLDSRKTKLSKLYFIIQVALTLHDFCFSK